MGKKKTVGGPHPVLKLLSANVKRMRLAKGWSIKECSERSGLDRTAWSRLENLAPEQSHRLERMLIPIAECFGCKVADLLRDREQTLKLRELP